MFDDNLLSELPDSVGSLSQLECLSVASNALVLLPDLGRLQKLMSLNAARNKLSSLPASLANCSSLEELQAPDNYLQVSF